MRVLLVEPDNRERARIAAALERRGCVVLTARGYFDALGVLCHGEPVRAVCVAEALPSRSGPDLLAALERRAAAHPVATVLRVSDVQSVVARALVEAGDGVVDRRAAPDAVADVVLAAVARRHADGETSAARQGPVGG